MLLTCEKYKTFGTFDFVQWVSQHFTVSRTYRGRMIPLSMNILYALYEYLHLHDIDKVSEIYNICFILITHSKLFRKTICQCCKIACLTNGFTLARKYLGRSFIKYVDLELMLREVDWCRAHDINYLKAMPHNYRTWSKYAMLKILLVTWG